MLETTTYKHIATGDLDKCVRETYGRPYCFQQQGGCQERGVVHVTVPAEPNDFEASEIPEVVNGEERGVSFAAWLARDPNAPLGGDRADAFGLGLFWKRNFYPSIDMVLNDLHARGLLEAGEYVIVIDW
jgi:hypothetical protein